MVVEVDIKPRRNGRILCSRLPQTGARLRHLPKATDAIHILDRFDIMSHSSKAIDKVRAQEARDLVSKGLEPVLKGSRFLLLKRPQNLTEKQEVKLADLVRYNLKSVRAYLLKEDFQIFWTYVSSYWAGRFLDQWCKRTMRSRIDPMKKVAKSLRKHRQLLLNWFRAQGQISTGIVEGLNNKAKVTMRNAYGYKSHEILETRCEGPAWSRDGRRSPWRALR